MPFLKINKQKIWNINIFGHAFKWTVFRFYYNRFNTTDSYRNNGSHT